MFLKKEKDPTSQQFDDDEWFRFADGSARSHRRRPERLRLVRPACGPPEQSSAHSSGRILAEVCPAAAPRAQ